jgi:hypothetical protein
MKVVFCLPGRSFSNNFLQSWTELLSFLPRYGITPILSNQYDSVVYYVRNKCLGGSANRGRKQKPFNGEINYDYLMWIDSDMVFTVDDFISLINMNVPIASGLYKTSDNIHYATVKDWDKEYYKQNGSFQFLTEQSIKGVEKPFEVDYTGFGWMLIKKGVFESLDYPWFRPEWEDFGNDISEFTSEDVGFCKNIREKGYKIHVNPKVIVGHEKTTILK